MALDDRRKYSVEGDFPFLGFLFPGYQVIKRGSWITRNSVVIGDGDTGDTGGFHVVLISQFKGKSLKVRVNFLEFIKEYHILGEKSRREAESLGEGEFWEGFKSILLLGRVLRKRQEGSLFDLFGELFKSFKESYSIYRKTGINHGVVFSSLLTMMLKAKNLEADQVGISIPYRKVLMRNRGGLKKYQGSVLGYLESPQMEEDFILFLYQCSE